jgi:AcrR family transcriptional regulator
VTTASEAPRSRLYAEKRDAIISAARRVFGRDGYARASIDAIAGESGVSTRTIYKHFENKEKLFTAVLLASANQVADGFLARLTALPATGDVASDLVEVGLAVVHQAKDFPEHFAMVRQISAEAPHFPPGVYAAWRDAGPLRVEGGVADHLRALAAAGALQVSDASLAALHLMALVTAEMRGLPDTGGPERTPAQVRESVTAAVRVFLHGYLASPASRPLTTPRRRRGSGSD